MAQDIGSSRGSRTSKVHAVVDEHGRPPRFIITGGQVYDDKVLADLLDGPGSPLAVVPTKINVKIQIPHDTNLYKMRNIVERFFCTMKDMRRPATRFEELSQNFLAMVHIFAIRMWIN